MEYQAGTVAPQIIGARELFVGGMVDEIGIEEVLTHAPDEV